MTDIVECAECGEPVDVEIAHGELTDGREEWWHEDCCPRCALALEGDDE